MSAKLTDCSHRSTDLGRVVSHCTPNTEQKRLCANRIDKTKKICVYTVCVLNTTNNQYPNWISQQKLDKKVKQINKKMKADHVAAKGDGLPWTVAIEMATAQQCESQMIAHYGSVYKDKDKWLAEQAKKKRDAEPMNVDGVNGGDSDNEGGDHDEYDDDDGKDGPDHGDLPSEESPSSSESGEDSEEEDDQEDDGEEDDDEEEEEDETPNMVCIP